MMDKDTNELAGEIKAWYECPHCDETHYFNIRYNKTLLAKIDVVKEIIESAISTFRFEIHKKHDIKRTLELDMDRLFFCEV